MSRLWIVGGGGAALEAWAVHQAMESAGMPQPPLAGFLVVAPPDFSPGLLEVRDEGSFLEEADCGSDLIVLGIGQPSLRDHLSALYASKGFRFATLVHPTVVRGPRTFLGEGSVVMAGAVLETDVTLGPHAFLNVQVSLAHQCSGGRCCNLGPGVHLAGKVRLGNRCDLGVGAVVRPGVRLGDDVVVGAGAAVVGDWEGPVVIAGVPAKRLKVP